MKRRHLIAKRRHFKSFHPYPLTLSPLADRSFTAWAWTIHHMRRHIPLYSTAIMERSLSCRSLHLHHDASAHLRVAEHELVGILHLCRDKRIAIQHHAFRESVLPEVEPADGYGAQKGIWPEESEMKSLFCLSAVAVCLFSCCAFAGVSYRQTKIPISTCSLRSPIPRTPRIRMWRNGYSRTP